MANTKKSEVLNALDALITKKASEASGIVGKETNPTSASDQPINKDEVKPETAKQEVSQEKATDASAPAASPSKEDPAKVASSVEKLGSDLLAAIEKLQKKQASEATGVPVNQTNPVSASDQPVDKDKIKPETNAQTVTMTPSTDAAAPAAAAKSASATADTEKLISYLLGKMAAEMVQKQAAENDPVYTLAKKAGRREYEKAINDSYAAFQEKQAKIKKQLTEKQSQIKQASEQEKRKQAFLAKQAADEEAGRNYFEQIQKQAADEVLIEKLSSENQELNQKLAEIVEYATALEVKLNEKEATEKEHQKIAMMTEAITRNVYSGVESLLREPRFSTGPRA